MGGRKRKRRNKSSEKTFEDLVKYCSGESLSLSTLQLNVEAACPEAIQGHTAHGCTLLHFACFNQNVSLETVEYLVDLYPDAVEHAMDDGQYPLHRACLNVVCPSSVIEYLVSKCPRALTVPWSHSGLPLHCLLSRLTKQYNKDLTIVKGEIHLDLRSIEVLVEAYPEALTDQTNSSSSTPLLLACKRDDVSLDMIRMLVDVDHASFYAKGGYSEELPIHALFSAYRPKDYCLPLEIIRFFVECAPSSLIAHDKSGGSPLHSACRNKRATIKAVQLFVKTRHDLVEQEDGFRNLPLHTICLNNDLNDSSRLEIMKYLIQEYPESIRKRNSFGMLPIDYTAGNSFELTQFLFSQYPEAVRNIDHEGRLPFHSACRHGSLKTVKYLFDLYPGCITLATYAGDRPLHKAVEYPGKDESLAKIQFLVQQYPEAAAQTGEGGMLPLHRACEAYCQGLSVIQLLFNAFPEAIHVKDDKGRLPLHCACVAFMCQTEVIEFFATQLPYSLKAKDNDGRTPAHYACSRACSLDEVKNLIDLCPDALRVNSPKHGLPIHCACTNQNSLDTVKYLESIYPASLNVDNESVGLPLHCATGRDIVEYLFLRRYGALVEGGTPLLHALFQDNGIRNKAAIATRFIDYFGAHARDIDKLGAFPLHLAVGNISDANFINKLIDLKPDAIKAQDSRGWLPLHYALLHNAPIEIVTLLLDNHPSAAQVVDNLGRSGLHVASHHDPSLAVVMLLLERHSEAIRTLDHNGFAPLHVVSRHGAPLEVIESLVGADETTLDLPDRKGELPIHKACRGGHITIVRYLLERNMPSCAVRNSSGVLPVFLLCQSSGKTKGVKKTPEYVETIWHLLLAHPEAVMSSH